MGTLLVATVCAGCSSLDERETSSIAPAVKRSASHARELSLSRPEDDLQRGIRSYEDAEYELAARQLQSALERGLTTPKDKVSAYKYLAFVSCASGRERSCQAEFRKALEVDPTFKLTPAEAGHPIWGPVFRSVKLEMTAKARSR
jgi:Tfp pilus assembly protein PilF